MSIVQRWNTDGDPRTRECIDLLEADREIDTKTDPWSLVLLRRGTKTELLRVAMPRRFTLAQLAVEVGKTVLAEGHHGNGRSTGR